MKEPSKEKPRPKTFKVRRIIGVIGLLSLLLWAGAMWLLPKMEGVSLTIAKNMPVMMPAPDKERTKKAETLTVEIEELVSKHNALPSKRELGLFSFKTSQEGNQERIENLTEILAAELGNPRALGAIRALNELRQEEEAFKASLRGEMPEEIREKIQKDLKKNQSQQKSLVTALQQGFEADGLPLSEEEIQSLAMSPNHQELAGLISSFGAIRKISLTMETRMRENPSQDSAQRYYGAHCVLLQTLDRIQNKATDEIAFTYIPRTEEILSESQFRKDEAKLLLKTKGDVLSENQKRALEENIQGLETTITLSHITLSKLRENLSILLAANDVLRVAIQTAENSHATAVLQREILTLATGHADEISQIQALIIPELIAINFADPGSPKLPEKPKM